MKCENRTCGSNVNGWCQFEAEGDALPSFCSLHELVSLTKKQDEYIKLLTDELSSCASVASIYGWQSEQFDSGERLRLDIEAIEKKANDNHEAEVPKEK